MIDCNWLTFTNARPEPCVLLVHRPRVAEALGACAIASAPAHEGGCLKEFIGYNSVLLL
jgi:hypothetical protein